MAEAEKLNRAEGLHAKVGELEALVADALRKGGRATEIKHIVDDSVEHSRRKALILQHSDSSLVLAAVQVRVGAGWGRAGELVAQCKTGRGGCRGARGARPSARHRHARLPGASSLLFLSAASSALLRTLHPPACRSKPRRRFASCPRWVTNC